MEPFDLKASPLIRHKLLKIQHLVNNRLRHGHPINLFISIRQD